MSCNESNENLTLRKEIMSDSEDFVISSGQLIGLAALSVAGIAVKLVLFKMADKGRKRRIAELETVVFTAFI